MATQTKTAQVAEISQMILGLRKHYPTGSGTLQIGGVTYTIDSLVAILQQVVDLRAAVDAAKVTLNTKFQAEQAQESSSGAVTSALKTYVRGIFGAVPDSLADFGLTPFKVRTPPTATEKAVAVAKREATRIARGTKGKVQKKDIKGAVTATLVVTPATTGQPAVSPPAAPATVAPPIAPVTHT
jgi:hypothetical protein